MKWIVALSPDGAARIAAQSIAQALGNRADVSSVKLFDTLAYRSYFERELTTPDPDMVADLLNQSLVVQTLDMEATHCLVCALAPITGFTTSLLKRHGIETILWFYEDYRRATYWKDVISSYMMVYGMQHGALEKACRESGIVFQFLPPAADANCQLPVSEIRSIDIAFIGQASPYRAHMLACLAQSKYSIAIAGNGWEQYSVSLGSYIVNKDWTDPATTAQFLRRSRIGINLSVTDPATDRDNMQVSPRVYDILAAECTLLTEDTPLAHEQLGEYCYSKFTDAQSLITACKDALVNYTTGEPARKQNRVTVLHQDMWAHRIDQLIHPH